MKHRVQITREQQQRIMIPFQYDRLVCDFRDTVARDCKSRMRDYATYIFFSENRHSFYSATAKRLAWTGEVSIHSYIKSLICYARHLTYYSPGFKVALMQAANRSINSQLVSISSLMCAQQILPVIPQSRSSLTTQQESSMILLTHLYMYIQTLISCPSLLAFPVLQSLVFARIQSSILHIRTSAVAVYHSYPEFLHCC